MTRAFLAVALLALAFNGQSADDAASLAARAEQVLDRWDGNAAALEDAGKAIEQAVQLEPNNAHFRGIQARQILVVGTTQDAIDPAALKKASPILFRAALEMQPPDARVFATLARVWRRLGNMQKVPWALNRAKELGPRDPWVKLALAEESDEFRYLQEAVDDGLASPVELHRVLHKLLQGYTAARRRPEADSTYARWIQVEPRNAYIRGDYGRDVVSMFLDFNSGERLAREALALAEYPHARQTLSMSLYGQWAQAARDGAGPDRIKALYDKAQANDPGGRSLPECLADWPPLQYVFVRLEQKSIRREQMHKC